MKQIHLDNCLYDIMKNRSNNQRCIICREKLIKGHIVIRMSDSGMMSLKMHIECALQFSDNVKKALDEHGSKILYKNL